MKTPTRPALERDTRQKRAIREVFLQSERPLSVDEVRAAAARLSQGLSTPTVYRSIRSLISDGWLAVVELPGRTPVYETAERDHHHHFSCTRCARVFELAGCASVDHALPDGFAATGHEVTVVGLCESCNARKKARSR